MRLSVVRSIKGPRRRRITTRASPVGEHGFLELHEEPSRKRRRGFQSPLDRAQGIIDNDAFMLPPEGAETIGGETAPTVDLVVMEDLIVVEDSGKIQGDDTVSGNDDGWVDESDEEDDIPIGAAALGWVSDHLGGVLLAGIAPWVLLFLLSIARSATPGSAHAGINYASHTEGAHTLAEFISTTHGLPFWTRAIVWATHYGDNSIDLSNEILNDEVSVGQCWPFWGSSGHVAISLSQRVEVKRMRVSHVKDDNPPAEAFRQAPRDIALWGLRTDLNLTTRLTTDFTTATHRTSAGWTNVPLFELLGRYTFDTKSLDQWFEVENPDAVSFSTVLVEILTNWGGRSTCIYSIGIYA